MEYVQLNIEKDDDLIIYSNTQLQSRGYTVEESLDRLFQLAVYYKGKGYRIDWTVDTIGDAVY